MLEGDTLAMDRIAAAEVMSGLVRMSPTKRISGRTHHRIGSQRSRYSSSAVTRICEVGAIAAARCNARCRSVAEPPRQLYCTGVGSMSRDAYGAHSGAWSSAVTMHQWDFRGGGSELTIDGTLARARAPGAPRSSRGARFRSRDRE